MTSLSAMKQTRIETPQSDLDDLVDRLARTRWSGGPTDSGTDRGVPAERLHALVDRWRASFDWRAVEAEMNRWNPTIATVDDDDLLLLHAASAEPDALPLMLNHGYPSSPIEFLDVIAQLTDPVGHGGDPSDAFTVVVPFLPGFGLAPELHDHGWSSARIASAQVDVMHGLGYLRYGVQGGDVGGGVAGDMAVADPAGVVGMHLVSDAFSAGAVLSFAGVTLDPEQFDESLQPLVQRVADFVREGLGYLALAGTRPATIGVALDDSPAGLLAWIAEKFEDWTDLDNPGPSRTVPIDRLLATVTAYWLGRTGSASAHFLYDARHGERDWGAQPTVPQGWAVFGGGGALVRQLMDSEHRIAHWSEYSVGGHFAALEAPLQFVADVRDFFRPLR